MNKQPTVYGKLCSLFYDATKAYASEREVSFYTSFIEHNPGRVLEAMSGSGRLQIPLLQRGYTVDGVDNSPIMLARCRERCAALNLAPQLYEQTLEELVLPFKYHTVTIAVGSFQLIVDRDKALLALQNLRVHMYNGANLLLDSFVPDVTLEERSTRIARIDQHTIVRLTKRYVFNQQEKIADAFCLYELIVNGKVQEQENELLQVVWYTDSELIQLLEQAGFTVIKIYNELFHSAGPSRIVHAQV